MGDFYRLNVFLFSKFSAIVIFIFSENLLVTVTFKRKKRLQLDPYLLSPSLFKSVAVFPPAQLLPLPEHSIFLLCSYGSVRLPLASQSLLSTFTTQSTNVTQHMLPLALIFSVQFTVFCFFVLPHSTMHSIILYRHVIFVDCPEWTSYSNIRATIWFWEEQHTHDLLGLCCFSAKSCCHTSQFESRTDRAGKRLTPEMNTEF